MALSIKDPETDRLARELAAATGETMTAAIREAVRERLERQKRRKSARVIAAIRRIQERVARMPVLDDRSPDEIIGYDEYGVPR